MSTWNDLPHGHPVSELNIWVFPRIGVPPIIHLIGFSIINHPFWGTPIFGTTHIQEL